ncbi:MAG: VCBS repeat-containing protein, partial [Bacteroidales bacterium]|nr:VCBS repeat-containing protein [Bacteroidales bacterium]
MVASSESEGTVTVTCADWSTTANLVAGGSVTINVPYETATTTLARWTRPCYSRQIRPAGIHVTATTDIALYAYNYNTASFDATTVLPTRTLGKHYILNDFDYYTQPGIVMLPDYYDGGEMCIVATENNTTVDIEFHSTVQIDTFAFSTSAWQTTSHSTHTAGSHFRTLTLQKGQYIQLMTPGVHSFAGTEISSTKPVAVFMGRKRTVVPYARDAAGNISTSRCCADHMYEQAIPTEQWGTEFVIVPDHRTTNSNRSYFDIVSLEDDCTVTCRTASGTVFSIPTLASGENYLCNMSNDNSPVYIIASKPVSVCLYLGSNRFCGNEGDPSSIVIPPIDRGTNRAVFFAFDNLSFSHRTNIVVPTAAVEGMRLDGTDISGQFTPIGSTELSYARVSIISGIHTLINRQGGFNAWFYGMAGAGSYAYTAAMGLRNLQYELFVDGDNTYTWGDTVSLCGLTHHFKIETDGDIGTRWYVDEALQAASDTALDVTFATTGYHVVKALQRGDCTVPDFCDTLRLVVQVNPNYSVTVYDTVDDIDLPRVYNGDNHYLPVTDSVYHLTNASGCDSTVHYNLHVRRTVCPATSTVGRDFWVMFPYNAYDYGYDNTRKISLIASGTENATITISSANPSWSTTAALTAGEFVEVEVPQYFTRIPTNIVENHGIHVTSTADISLYASNYIYQSYDIATVLPTSTLRNRYIVQDYPGSSVSVEDDASGSEIGIVATEDGTVVQVTLTASDRYHSAGETFTVTLNAGYDFQLLSNPGNTFSGTEIISTNGKPVAVFQGTRITRIPSNSVCCGDYLFEQAIPVDYWGKEFVLVPEQRDVTNQIRITSADDNCQLALDDTPIATINAKQTYQISLPPGTAQRLTASKPVSVCLYLSGTNGERGDPASVVIPPVEQGVCNATVYAHNTLRTDQHYTNIVTTTTHVPGMTLDEGSIASYFTPLSGTQYSYAKVPISSGTHTLENTIGAFSAFFYGMGIMESYAYTSGMGLKQLRNEWTVDGIPHSRASDTMTLCNAGTTTFNISPADSSDTTVRWFVNGIEQDENALTFEQTFMLNGLTNTVMAVMHGDCAPGWCDTLSIIVRTIPTPSSVITRRVYADSLPYSLNGIDYTFTGYYHQNITTAEGCDSTLFINLSVIPHAYDDHVHTTPTTPVVIYPTLNDSIPCDNPSFSIITQPIHGYTNIGSGSNEGVDDGDIPLFGPSPSNNSSKSSSTNHPNFTYTPSSGSFGGPPFIGVDSIQVSVCCEWTTPPSVETSCDTSWIHIMVAPLPDNIIAADCTVLPDSNAFDMTELFACTGGTVNSMSTPMVADMDGDGLPEIIACKNTSNSPWYSTDLLVFNGQTGSLIKTISTAEYVLHGQCIAVADIDGDHQAEIFLLDKMGYLHCYNYSGSQRWLNASDHVGWNFLLSVADIMGDGTPELVCGNYIFNANDGTLLVNGTMQEDGQGFAAPHGYNALHIPYYMYALADIDCDGKLELCAGNSIYKINITNNSGTAGNRFTLFRQAESNASIANLDGQTFVLDFDGDGDLDICVIGTSHEIANSSSPATSHTIYPYVWDAQTGSIVAYSSLAVGSNYGASIPFGGDLDGDGLPEIVFSVFGIGMQAYAYDATQPGNMRLKHSHAPFAETAGFTAFDFNQDGHDEIVYRGTDKLFIV